MLAACPDDDVRDGREALRLAQRSMELRQTIDHAETVAMALAELGRFDEARSLQEQVVAQRQAQGESRQLSRSQRYLEVYQQQRPVRAPWLEGA